MDEIKFYFEYLIFLDIQSTELRNKKLHVLHMRMLF